ncbi:peptidase MA superfamily [Hemileuca sp. nucleopolyhedrovirus]|uniref:Peptidase MA superfamily n=1 Tax=Hemileuca sp. nucleopolyhedrovirus TaxID=1367203 RepID=S5N9F3_9ABAC|nr:peptidase MA superfamily [Hemileuca sp. nucleopolyhedrovirus]AGR56882.1 peptidase MA superfamily [Hemileuca sp. nucleopolyhedrovirus]
MMASRCTSSIVRLLIIILIMSDESCLSKEYTKKSSVIKRTRSTVGGVDNYLDSFENINKLIDDVCTPKRFKSPLCDARILLYKFKIQTFNFKKENDIEKFGAWLRLLNNMYYYRSPSASTSFTYNNIELMDVLSDRCLEWVIVNAGITSEMKRKSYEVFRWISDTWVRFHVKNNYAVFKNTLFSFVNFFNTFMIWTNLDDIYLFKTVMYAYKNVRQSYPLQPRLIDEGALQSVRLALDYPLSMLIPKDVRQLFYILYVVYIEEKKEKTSTESNKDMIASDLILTKTSKLFEGVYERVDKERIMPSLKQFIVGPFVYRLYHNVKDALKVEAMINETNFVYDNVVQFYKRTNVSFNYHYTNMTVYVHENKKMYETLGPLWVIDTDNGGFTHFNRKSNTIESHVYYENDDDTLPLNYGHEIQHTVMYSLDAIRNVPLWFIEGVANRIGNRKCYRRDHINLKRHINSSIETILAATYGSEILYSMGSVLVAFFYETKPFLLGTMLRSRNFRFTIDKQTNLEFDHFKFNKIHECEKFINENDNGRGEVSDLIQQRYLNTIRGIDFKCRNFIKFDFDNVVFVMTRFKLIKINKKYSHYKVNTQKEIKYNNEPISNFDYNWFLKGILKKTLYHFGDKFNVFEVDSIYTYNSNVYCGTDETITKDVFVFDALAEFGWRSGIWDVVSYLRNKNLHEGRSFIQNHLNNLKTCQLFLNPPNIYGSEGAFNNNHLEQCVLNVDRLTRMDTLNDTEKNTIIDVRGNTIIHLIAMFNHKLYKSNAYADNVANYDGLKPSDIFYYSVNFETYFKRTIHKYCYAFIDSYMLTTTTIKPTTLTSTIVNYHTYKPITSTSPKPTTTLLKPMTTSPKPTTTTKSTISLRSTTTTEPTTTSTKPTIISSIPKVIITSTASTNTVSTENDTKYNTTYITINTSLSSVYMYYVIIGLVISFLILLILIISINVLITNCIVSKRFKRNNLDKKNNVISSNVSFNKNKFYNNDEEFVIKLFE